MIPKELQSAFEPLTKAMDNWEAEIFAYFDYRVTNAYTESLNSLIRVINRLGRGYSFEVLRAKILFTEGLQNNGSLSISGGSMTTYWKKTSRCSKCYLLFVNQKKQPCSVSIFPP
jgi:hypothetical protein